MNYLKIIKNGIINENPIFVLLLGMCPTLATTTSAENGMGMGLATAFVLTCSNVILSAMKKLIPDQVRIPVYVVVVATLATILQMFMHAYMPALYKSLGIFIPLIAVNCIVIGRAESYASKNKVLPSFFDGLGIGLGFTIALTLLGILRELLGSGKIFGATIYPETYGTLIFILAPGAFIVMGYLIALINKISKKV